MSTTAANPIPTQLNIAPHGKTWKNWQLVDGEDGFKTREAMEKYHCNPERVRELEESRVLNLDTIDRLNARIAELEEQLEAVGAGGVQPLSCKGCCKRGDIVQIAEPEKVDELNCVCGATWVRHSNGVYGMTYLPRPAPKGHSITDALEALQEAEAALDVACARLEKQRADYPVGATSEGKALMLVRKVLAAQAKQGGAA